MLLELIEQKRLLPENTVLGVQVILDGELLMQGGAEAAAADELCAAADELCELSREMYEAVRTGIHSRLLDGLKNGDQNTERASDLMFARAVVIALAADDHGTYLREGLAQGKRMNANWNIRSLDDGRYWWHLTVSPVDEEVDEEGLVLNDTPEARERGKQIVKKVREDCEKRTVH